MPEASKEKLEAVVAAVTASVTDDGEVDAVKFLRTLRQSGWRIRAVDNTRSFPHE